MPNNQLTTTDGTVLDPKVLKVMKAIRQVESGGNYGAVGDSGQAHGAFQYNEQTGPGWKNIARQYLGDENAVMDKANQNKATYLRIKQWKDEGKQPEEIAALWNGAKKDPQTGLYTYNNPEYGEKFRNALSGGGETQFKTTLEPQTAPPAMKPNTAQPEPQEKPREGLGQKLSGRLLDYSDTLGRQMSGEQGLLSTGLQVAGTTAGGLLDIGGAALGAVARTLAPKPVEEAAEKVVGFVGEKIAETKLAQDLAKGWQEIEETNPVLADNLKAVGNIASFIPALKVAGAGVSVAKQGTGVLFRNSIEKAAEQELKQTVMRVRKGAEKVNDYAGRKIDPIGIMVRERILPDVEADAKGIPRYNTIRAENELETAIDLLDDSLDAELAKATGASLSGYVPLTSMKDIAIERIKKELKGSPDLDAAIKKVESDFDSIGMSYPDVITLNDLNNIKRMVRKSVNFDSPSMDRNIRYHEGQAIMKVIEDVAERQGVPGVRDINRQMAEKIEAQNILSNYINGKSVPENPGLRGILSRKAGDTATIAGEAVGQSFGVPGAGAVIGRGVAGFLARPGSGAVSSLQKIPARLKPQGPLAPR